MSKDEHFSECVRTDSSPPLGLTHIADLCSMGRAGAGLGTSDIMVAVAAKSSEHSRIATAAARNMANH